MSNPSKPRDGCLIGVDTGGTFTDVTLLDPATGRLWTAKTSSTPDDPSRGFGIGIAHGFATLGCIGFEGRFQYSATGTVANLASRLCDEARDGQILIDAKVHAAVEALAEFDSVGELDLKGFRHPVPAFNVRKLRT